MASSYSRSVNDWLPSTRHESDAANRSSNAASGTGVPAPRARPAARQPASSGTMPWNRVCCMYAGWRSNRLRSDASMARRISAALVMASDSTEGGAGALLLSSAAGAGEEEAGEVVAAGEAAAAAATAAAAMIAGAESLAAGEKRQRQQQ